MSAIDFCGICLPKPPHDEYGCCKRHGKPLRGALMPCIHCRPAMDGSKPTAPYGDACPKCGSPCVGELGEPAIVLPLSSDGYVEHEGCGCYLECDSDTARLYRCKLHHEAWKTQKAIDEACLETGTDGVEGLAEAAEKYHKERGEALDALGVDDQLDGKELTEAIEKAELSYDPEAQDRAELADRLLDAVGMADRDWADGRDPWLRAKFDPVEFLVARLRELAPERLKTVRPVKVVKPRHETTLKELLAGGNRKRGAR